MTEQIFGKKAEEFLWQDREIRFDLPPVDLQCRRGENVLHTLVRPTAAAHAQLS